MGLFRVFPCTNSYLGREFFCINQTICVEELMDIFEIKLDEDKNSRGGAVCTPFSSERCIAILGHVPRPNPPASHPIASLMGFISLRLNTMFKVGSQSVQSFLF